MNQDINMVISMPMNLSGNRGAAGQMQSITNVMSQVMSVKLASVK